MKKIRCESNETLGRKAIANVFDVIDQTPPFLNHNYTWTIPLRWNCQITIRRPTIRLELR